MIENNKKPEEQSVKGEGAKKPFIEPEIKEFDDLEKKVSTLIGHFTP